MRRLLTKYMPAASLLLMSGCDDVTSQVLDTILFAFEIVEVWV